MAGADFNHGAANLTMAHTNLTMAHLHGKTPCGEPWVNTYVTLDVHNSEAVYYSLKKL